MKILTKTLFVLFAITIVLELVDIYFTNTQSVGSIQAGKLAIEINDLREENSNLSTNIMVLSSLEEVSSRAIALGFIESKETISLFKPQDLALNK